MKKKLKLSISATYEDLKEKGRRGIDGIIYIIELTLVITLILKIFQFINWKIYFLNPLYYRNIISVIIWNKIKHYGKIYIIMKI